jgi:hypothetical protein
MRFAYIPRSFYLLGKSTHLIIDIRMLEEKRKARHLTHF